MGTDDYTLIQLPITLRDKNFQYYNLAALENNGQQSEHIWKNYWPDYEDDENEGDNISNFDNNDKIEADDGNESNFDIDEDGNEWAEEEENRMKIDEWK